jgi:hypothetical protein
VFLLARPVLTVARSVKPPVLESSQVSDIGLSDDNHITAVTAVAAVRAAKGDELLSAESDHSIAAITGPYCDFYPVEHYF